MKKIFLVLVLCIVTGHTATAQATLREYTIGKSGCRVMMYPEASELSETTMDDGTNLDGAVKYMLDAFHEDATYGLILIQSAKPLPTDKKQLELELAHYLDFLKNYTMVKEQSEHRGGLSLPGYAPAVGIAEQWKDIQQARYQVQAWANSRFLCILYVKCEEDIAFPAKEKIQAFFNGFKFAP